jgi:hypothetical protein
MTASSLIVAVAPDWDSMRGELQRFERSARSLASGRGIRSGSLRKEWARLGPRPRRQDESGLRKRNAMVRASGRSLSHRQNLHYDPALPPGAKFPFHQVTKADAWIDDPTPPGLQPLCHIDDPEHPPPWFAKEKMRHNDFAYRWLVEIRHNSDPPQPNEGSADLFPHPARPARPLRLHDNGGERSRALHQLAAGERHPCYVLLAARVL